MTISIAAMMMLGTQASLAAAVEREKSLAWLSSILGTRVEVNEHGAIELTDDQIETLKAAAPTRVDIAGEPTWTGIPIWRLDPYVGDWECDERGEWRRCFAPGCTHNRRRVHESSDEEQER